MGVRLAGWIVRANGAVTAGVASFSYVNRISR